MVDGTHQNPATHHSVLQYWQLAGHGGQSEMTGSGFTRYQIRPGSQRHLESKWLVGNADRAQHTGHSLHQICALA